MQTFFITDANDSKRTSKPARACDFCYDAVFPVLDPDTPEQDDSSSGQLPHYSSIGTLTALPFSRSTPSLALPQTTPSVLYPPPLHYELPTPVKRYDARENERPISGLDFLPISRPRLTSSRPPSEIRSSSYTTSTTISSALARDSTHDLLTTPSSQGSPAGLNASTDSNGHIRPKITFAEPAVALHTTPVTARASTEGEGKSKRFSLVLGNKSRLVAVPGVGNKENIATIDERRSLDSSFAALKLTDILVRK